MNSVGGFRTLCKNHCPAMYSRVIVRLTMLDLGIIYRASLSVMFYPCQPKFTSCWSHVNSSSSLILYIWHLSRFLVNIFCVDTWPATVFPTCHLSPCMPHPQSWGLLMRVLSSRAAGSHLLPPTIQYAAMLLEWGCFSTPLGSLQARRPML